ncbi:MAG: type II/IV secretion system protein [Planctomycetes bacterium]|nr:type II/IV secretion system protein [Planctomycetota bacterium]
MTRGTAAPAPAAGAPADSAGTPATAPAGGLSAPVEVIPADAFPRSPTGFFRGNSKGSNGSGFYINLWGLIPVIGLFLLWVHTTNWADDDAQGLKINHEFWNCLLILVGAAGFVAVLALPSFFLGFITLLTAYALPIGLYVRERNDRVPDAARVMTPKHIQGLVIRGLAKIGIHIAVSKGGRDSALGPPIRFIGKSDGKGNDGGRSKQAEKSRGFVSAKELVYDAIMRRATDIHLEPKEDEYSVRYRIDGVMYPAEPFDRAMGESIVNIFKVLGAMDITEKRKSQDGSFRAQLEKRVIDFRAATQGTGSGEKISLRILDQANSVSKLEQLNMRKQMLEQLREIIHQPHGLFLSCGPTGAGKSTTLYAALNDIDAYQQNIITVEDPVEYKIANVTQIEVNTKSGNTFGNSLRSILRQDPDVVMIGEIRDAETAKIACQAANTGHMVFSTVHANDTISALYRVIDLGVEPFLLSSALSGILGQRLVRRLCEECKEKYVPKPELLKQAGLPADKVEAFYRPPTNAESPCPNCSGLGYRGRLGVFELFTINERLRDMIREGKPVAEIRSEARKNGMLYMKEEGLRLVVKGLTSIQELQANVK